MILWEQGQEGGRTRPVNREVLFNNLCEVWEVLKRNNIKCWLAFGTMLGAYRDNNIIPYDDDIDIGADIATAQNRLKMEQELRDLGYFVPPIGDRSKPVNPIDNMPYSDTVAIRDGEKIEIWWFQKIDNEYCYDVHRPPVELKHNEKYYDTLSKFNFKGKEFDIPNHIDEWIVMMYSNDWNIPQKGRKYNH